MKNTVIILGVILALVGVIGFFNDPVIGLFEVDVLHNIIHLVTGALLIGFGLKTAAQLKSWAKIVGAFYGVIAIVGLILPGDRWLGLFAINTADNLLHVALALILLWIGFSGDKAKAPASAPVHEKPQEKTEETAPAQSPQEETAEASTTDAAQ